MWLELILVPDEVAKSWGSRGINRLGPESSYALVAEAAGTPVSLLLPLRREGCVENQYCLRCHREIESRDKSVAVYMFAQTVGVRPRTGDRRPEFGERRGMYSDGGRAAAERRKTVAHGVSRG